MRNRAIYENRYYEGEHAFRCPCGAKTVLYAFQDEDLRWLGAGSIPCEVCSQQMYYEGYDTNSDSITQGLKSLIDSKNYMAAIVVIGAFVEYQMDNLLWGLLRDAGLPSDKATAIANGTHPRGSAVRMIRDLTGRKVGNIVFPMRNEVAHGQAFGRSQDEYIQAISEQFDAIDKWVMGIKSTHIPQQTNYTELDRWLLSMEHWTNYVKSYWKDTHTS